jgi:cytochrome c oxidase cbb3-type subunit 3
MSDHIATPAPLDTESDPLTPHDYDGIREFDNPTPGWWHLIFVGSIIFSIFYYVFFQFSPVAWTPHDVHAAAEIANLKKQFSELGTLAQDEPTMLRMMNDPKWLSVGQSVFRSNCVSCHADKGQGIVGPNLTDNHFKNIKKLTDICTVVSNGAANGAMPAWKINLHPNEIVLVSAYVATMRGQNIPGGRGQIIGDTEIPAWPLSTAISAPSPSSK